MTAAVVEVVERTLVKLITAEGLDNKLASVKRVITGVVESCDFESYCKVACWDLCGWFCWPTGLLDSEAPGDKLDVDVVVFGEVFAAVAK